MIAEEKDGQIAEFKKHIDKLQGDFAKMLNETLTKIKAKIEMANK